MEFVVMRILVSVARSYSSSFEGLCDNRCKAPGIVIPCLGVGEEFMHTMQSFIVVEDVHDRSAFPV
eukprot:10984992-Karenia_brevis.AAC.1